MLNRVRGFLRRLGRNEPVYTDANGLPFPPAQLRSLVAGTDDLEWFIEGGRLGAESIRDVLQRNNLTLEAFDAILDFGCGSGRVIRYWSELPQTEVYGCDYNDKLIRWCQTHLTFAHFQTNQLSPPLPYANDQFDLVYALSVFTHMPEALQQQWLQELSRVIKPGGFLLITTHGEFYLDQMTNTERQQFTAGELVIRKSRRAGSNDCAAFHPRPYLENKMLTQFTLVDFIPEGAKGNPRQDLSLLQKQTTRASHTNKK